jgi:hypothetical protein
VARARARRRGEASQIHFSLRRGSSAEMQEAQSAMYCLALFGDWLTSVPSCVSSCWRAFSHSVLESNPLFLPQVGSGEATKPKTTIVAAALWRLRGSYRLPRPRPIRRRRHHQIPAYKRERGGVAERHSSRFIADEIGLRDNTTLNLFALGQTNLFAV